MKAFWLLARLLGSAGIVLLGGCDGRACCGQPPVASVTVAPAAAALTVGDTVRLASTVKDAGNQVLTDRVVTWTSRAPSVATVSATGLVTGVHADAAAVTITATSEGVSGTATVVVRSLPGVASVTVAPPAAALLVGDTMRLVATVKDSGGHVLTDRAVTWTSSSPSVATVSISGLVTGVQANAQAATITATSEGMSGSAAVTVASLGSVRGEIAFVSHRDGSWEIYVMDADGSGHIKLTNNPVDDSYFDWSPDGRKLAFQSYRDGNLEIYVMNADGSGQVNLTNNLAYDQDAAWSPDGTKIAFGSNRDGGNREIYVMNADGSGVTRLTNNPAEDLSYPAWSPDGAKIAFTSWRDGNREIYVVNTDGSGLHNLTSNPGADAGAAWSPDGTKIAFGSDRDGNWEIYVMNADGSGAVNLTNNPAADGAVALQHNYYPDVAWSPDATRIVFPSKRDGNVGIYVMNADGSGVRNLTNSPANEHHAAWSPDGTWVAFVSDRDGNDEIYVMKADGSGQRNVTNNPAQDGAPIWRPQQGSSTLSPRPRARTR